jgi:hypothetical protein
MSYQLRTLKNVCPLLKRDELFGDFDPVGKGQVPATKVVGGPKTFTQTFNRPGQFVGSFDCFHQVECFRRNSLHVLQLDPNKNSYYYENFETSSHHKPSTQI